MGIINFFSNIAIPLTILLIAIFGMAQRIKVFDVFLDGAKDGVAVIVNILPTLIGLFLAVSLLRSSGVLDFVTKILTPILSILKFPTEILPLALIRPISGSSAIAVATDTIKKYGVDTEIGILAAVVMGSTETAIYTIAVYTSSINIKKTRFVLLASLIGSLVGLIVSVIVCRLIL